MDELTRERFGVIAWWESRKQPTPKHERRVPISTEAQQLQRRQELAEALTFVENRRAA